jgi:hypothetical protein
MIYINEGAEEVADCKKDQGYIKRDLCFTDNLNVIKLLVEEGTDIDELCICGHTAYYSSGSRPNQSAFSWSFSRLAGSITAGKSASVNFNILDKGCNHKKKAFILANKSRQKYKYGQSNTRKVDV